MLRRPLLALAVAALSAVPAWSQTSPVAATAPAPRVAGVAIAGSEALAPHRAAYNLVLEHVRERSQVRSAKGAMLFEVADACEGWATRQRLTMTLTDSQGNDVETSSDYSTYESKDGRQLRFSMVQSSQGAVSNRIAGTAELQADGSGTVTYTEPTEKTEPLTPGTLLPMLHTLRAIQLARGDGRLLSVPLFDGTTEDGAQDSTTIVAGWSGPQANERFPPLAPLASGRMRIAFFSHTNTNGGGASAPDYEVGLRYYENGVADELSMDFGDFTMGGQLAELVILPSGC
ncbi:uncharacterized protein DUF1849 [Humitalea rosea]|uniref:Uncharacterized protein DUF1849 n=1 Tax=Humitalea rosea TaxID=990373 RepID=A0A2W7IRW5_9PROT|nr:DUF1849 family protein [Humitalea rosea]PZW42187.1 uncharacterized protein DUF1849 [Humitalea rosea]